MNVFLHLEADRTTDLFLRGCKMHYIASLRVYSESQISKNKRSCSHGIYKMILKRKLFFKKKKKTDTGKKLRGRIQSGKKREKVIE